MLQQTQVERVVPKYRQFLARFPDFPSLASASAGEVIRLWTPLGYNQRAVRLWRLARRVVSEHDGRLPSEPDALRSLEGVGEYTAAALQCFAFGRDVPVVDTNVRRVLGRVFWGTRSPSPKALGALAGTLVANGRAADWNQAVMDLGALVCTSRQPRCVECPLRPYCKAAVAFANGHRTIAKEGARYRAAPFQGSSRYYRGRILARLRDLAEGESMPLARLGAWVKPGYTAHERPWLEALVFGLERDGLLRRTPRGVALP